jgi:hypothetical protein
MKTKTTLKTGYQTGGSGHMTINHNETLAGGLRVKNALRAASGTHSGGIGGGAGRG